MVMIFANENARTQLLKHGVVVTFRVKKHKEGKDWATDRRCGKKIANINVAYLEIVEGVIPLARNVELSGFLHVWDWVEAIKSFHKLNLVRGYLYKVELRP